MVRALERGPAHDHLVQEHAQAPDVQGVVVALALDHFRRKVVEGAAECCPRDAGDGAPAEVRYLEHIIVGDEEVLRLQIPVHNRLTMQVLETARDLHEVVPRSGLEEAPTLARPQQLVQLTLGAVLEQQVHRLGVLKVPVEPEHVLVLQGPLHLDLALDLVDEVALNDLDLLHRLQRIDVTGALPPDPAHDAEAALPQGAPGVAV
mmetsp:Transcript_107214/g.303206  ORF Transcript_107214/g.303206 Transcript_107214/m.303206 type:complete len:205 (-) Transcript_107214:141-755(-)